MKSYMRGFVQAAALMLLPATVHAGAFEIQQARSQRLEAVFARARLSHSIRIAWAGTSITGGMGTAAEDPSRIDHQIQRLLGKERKLEVSSRNFAFGGGHSVVQLAILRRSILPWKPDLIFAELGTLDEFYPELSEPSIDAFARLAESEGAAVVLWLPFTRYSHAVAGQMKSIARARGVPFLDMAEYAAGRHAVLSEITEDGCHPNLAGRNLASDAIAAILNSSLLMVPASRRETRRSSLEYIRFFPFDSGTGSGVSAYFDPAEKAIVSTKETVVVQPFYGPIIVVLFRLGGVPAAIHYRIDSGDWRTADVQPDWFLNYVLGSRLSVGKHVLSLKLNPKHGDPLALDGFLAIDK